MTDAEIHEVERRYEAIRHRLARCKTRTFKAMKDEYETVFALGGHEGEYDFIGVDWPSGRKPPRIGLVRVDLDQKSSPAPRFAHKADLAEVWIYKTGRRSPARIPVK